MFVRIEVHHQGEVHTHRVDFEDTFFEDFTPWAIYIFLVGAWSQAGLSLKL